MPGVAQSIGPEEITGGVRIPQCSKSPYFVFFVHDCRSVLENSKPYGMGVFWGDLLESANAVIKDMQNNYSNRAGGRGAKTNVGEVWLRVVQQCQARNFLGNALPCWEGRTKGQVVQVAGQAHLVLAEMQDDTESDSSLDLGAYT